ERGTQKSVYPIPPPLVVSTLRVRPARTTVYLCDRGSALIAFGLSVQGLFVPVDHIGDPIPDRSGGQKRKQGLVGWALAHIVACPHAVSISRRCSVTDLLGGLDCCAPQCGARLGRCRLRLSGQVGHCPQCGLDATFRIVLGIVQLLALAIVAHSRPIHSVP